MRIYRKNYSAPLSLFEDKPSSPKRTLLRRCKQIRLALLEADVNFKVVKELIDRIQAKAVGQEVLTALSPGEQVIKIVRDELVDDPRQGHGAS